MCGCAADMISTQEHSRKIKEKDIMKKILRTFRSKCRTEINYQKIQHQLWCTKSGHLRQWHHMWGHHRCWQEHCVDDMYIHVDSVNTNSLQHTSARIICDSFYVMVQNQGDVIYYVDIILCRHRGDLWLRIGLIKIQNQPYVKSATYIFEFQILSLAGKYIHLPSFHLFPGKFTHTVLRRVAYIMSGNTNMSVALPGFWCVHEKSDRL